MVQPRNPYVREAVEEFLRTKAAREQATIASYSSILLGAEYGTRKPLGQPFARHFRNRKFDFTHSGRRGHLVRPAASRVALRTTSIG